MLQSVAEENLQHVNYSFVAADVGKKIGFLGKSLHSRLTAVAQYETTYHLNPSITQGPRGIPSVALARDDV